MKRYVAIFVLSILANIQASSAEDVTPGHINFEPTDSKIAALFATSVNDGTLFAQKDPPPIKASGEQSLIWAGSSAVAKTELKRATIHFMDESDKEYSVSVEYISKILNLKFLNATEKRFRDGFFAEISPSAPSQAFVAGPGDNGFLLLSPKTGPTDWIGFALCPLKSVVWKDEHNREKTKLIPTNYRPTSIDTPIKGSASGKYRSGSSTAQANAKVLTSPNIPPAGRPEEQISEPNPEVEVEYLPALAGWDQNSAPKTLSSGMQSSVELVAPGGQKRKVVSEAVVSVGEFPLTKQIVLSINGKETPIEHATCYAVLRHLGLFESYE